MAAEQEWTDRLATSADQAFITEMQYEALFVPPGCPPYQRSILDAPDIARYHADFGQAAGDVGVVAVDAAGEAIGAAWARLVAGYGYVDAETPELGIAVVADRRGRAVGSGLLRSLQELVPRLSLSVDRRNPARRLYEREGFGTVRRDGDSVVMLWTR